MFWPHMSRYESLNMKNDFKRFVIYCYSFLSYTRNPKSTLSKNCFAIKFLQIFLNFFFCFYRLFWKLQGIIYFYLQSTNDRYNLLPETTHRSKLKHFNCLKGYDRHKNKETPIAVKSNHSISKIKILYFLFLITADIG